MDIKAMASNIGLEEEDFIELLQMLINISLADIKKLETALASESYKEAAMSAHSIKGASANLGLTDISAVAAELEISAKNSEISSIPEKIDLLKQKLKHLSEILS